MKKALLRLGIGLAGVAVGAMGVTYVGNRSN